MILQETKLAHYCQLQILLIFAFDSVEKLTEQKNYPKLSSSKQDSTKGRRRNKINT